MKLDKDESEGNKGKYTERILSSSASIQWLTRGAAPRDAVLGEVGLPPPPRAAAQVVGVGARRALPVTFSVPCSRPVHSSLQCYIFSLFQVVLSLFVL